MWPLLLGACALTHIFVYNQAESIKCHNTKFFSLGQINASDFFSSILSLHIHTQYKVFTYS